MILFILVYIFSVIGYIGSGLFIYLNLDTYKFNKLGIFVNNILKYIFYNFNKDKCFYSEDNVLFYEKYAYYESELWKQKYELFNTLFEVICILFWPIWILINIIIDAFNDN